MEYKKTKLFSFILAIGIIALPFFTINSSTSVEQTTQETKVTAPETTLEVPEQQWDTDPCALTPEGTDVDLNVGGNQNNAGSSFIYFQLFPSIPSSTYSFSYTFRINDGVTSEPITYIESWCGNNAVCGVPPIAEVKLNEIVTHDDVIHLDIWFTATSCPTVPEYHSSVSMSVPGIMATPTMVVDGQTLSMTGIVEPFISNPADGRPSGFSNVGFNPMLFTQPESNYLQEYYYYNFLDLTTGGYVFTESVKGFVEFYDPNKPVEWVPTAKPYTAESLLMLQGHEYQGIVNSTEPNVASSPYSYYSNVGYIEYTEYVANLTYSLVPGEETNSATISWTWLDPNADAPLYWKIVPQSGVGTETFEGVEQHGSSGSTELNQILTHDTTYTLYVSTLNTPQDGNSDQFDQSISLQTASALTSGLTVNLQTNNTVTFNYDWKDTVNFTTVYYNLYKVPPSGPEEFVLSSAFVPNVYETFTLENLLPKTNYRIEVSSTNGGVYYSTNFGTVEGLQSVELYNAGLSGAEFSFAVHPAANAGTPVYYKVVNDSTGLIEYEGNDWSLTMSTFIIPEGTLKQNTAYTLYVSDSWQGSWETSQSFIVPFVTEVGVTYASVDNKTSDDALLYYGWPSHESGKTVYIRVYDVATSSIYFESTFSPSTNSSTGDEEIWLSETNGYQPLKASTEYNIQLSMSNAFAPDETVTSNNFTTSKFINQVIVTPGITGATFTYSTNSSTNQTFYYRVIDEMGTVIVPEASVSGNPFGGELSIASGSLKPSTRYRIQFTDYSGIYTSSYYVDFNTYQGISGVSQIGQTDNSVTIAFNWDAEELKSTYPVYYQILDEQGTLVKEDQFVADETNTYKINGLSVNQTYTLKVSMKQGDFANAETISISTLEGVTAPTIINITPFGATFSYTYDLTINKDAWYQVYDAATGTPVGTPTKFIANPNNRTFEVSGLQSDTTYYIGTSMYSDMRYEVLSPEFSTMPYIGLAINNVTSTTNSVMLGYAWAPDAQIPATMCFVITDENGVAINTPTPVYPSGGVFDLKEYNVWLESESKYTIEFYEGAEALEENSVYEYNFETASRISDVRLEETLATSATISFKWNSDEVDYGLEEVPLISNDGGGTWMPLEYSIKPDGRYEVELVDLTVNTEYQSIFSSSSSTVASHPNTFTFRTDYDYADVTDVYWTGTESDLTIDFFLDEGFETVADDGLWFYISTEKVSPSNPDLTTIPDLNKVEGQWINLTRSLPYGMSVNNGAGINYGGSNTIKIDEGLDQNDSYYFMIYSFGQYDPTFVQWDSIKSESTYTFPTSLVIMSSVLVSTIALGGGYVAYIQVRKRKISKEKNSKKKKIGIKR